MLEFKIKSRRAFLFLAHGQSDQLRKRGILPCSMHLLKARTSGLVPSR